MLPFLLQTPDNESAQISEKICLVIRDETGKFGSLFLSREPNSQMIQARIEATIKIQLVQEILLLTNFGTPSPLSFC